jgi:F-type H+-transporting ATPase subunit a
MSNHAILPATHVLAADNPLTHVVDAPVLQHGEFWTVSNVTLMLILGGTVMLVGMLAAARRIRTGTTRSIADYRTQGVWANIVESVCLYLRNDVFRPILQEYTDKYTPLLWTFFWFILINNLFGLVPFKDITALLGLNHGHGYGGTATQSIWVTGALALIAFLFINGVAFLKDPMGFMRHMTADTPWPMWIIMIPVELIGLLVKPFALAMRLFANMTGGHVVVAVMLSFVKMLIEWQPGGLGYGMSLLPVGAIIALYFLEVLVAFIQAFVFTFLTCLFLGTLIVHEQGHGHADGALGHGNGGHHGDHKGRDAVTA